MKNNSFSYNTPEIVSIIGTIDTYLKWREKTNEPRRYDVYHPSEFGGCARSMQYKRYAFLGLMQHEEEEFDTRMLRLFETGHHTQGRWEKYFTAMGILRGVWSCANPLCYKWNDNGIYEENINENITKKHKRRIYGLDNKIGCFKPEKCTCGSSDFFYEEVSAKAPDMNMYGHTDMILGYSRFDPSKYEGVLKTFEEKNLPKNPIVADMKTIKAKGFDDMVKFGKPPSFKYQIQLQIYCNVLDCEYGVLIYECKDDSRVATYKIERNEEVWEDIQRQAKMMIEMADGKDENGNNINLLPPPKYSDKKCYECNYCQFKKKCHSSSIWNNPELDNVRKYFYGSLLED